MRILNRLKNLSAEARRRIARRPRIDKEERAQIRAATTAAGIRPVDDFDDLTSEEWNQFCRFHDIDHDRDRYDMPCNSWLFAEYGSCITQVMYWYSKLERGEITREEYHRLVLAFEERLKAYAAAGGSKDCGSCLKGWDPRTGILPIDWVPPADWPLCLLRGG